MPKGDPKKKVFYGNSLASYKEQEGPESFASLDLSKMTKFVLKIMY